MSFLSFLSLKKHHNFLKKNLHISLTNNFSKIQDSNERKIPLPSVLRKSIVSSWCAKPLIKNSFRMLIKK
ncbi:CLUMA_CG018616, isoform A [Clunio marinus]|uniref:CLUMA_CG018616, isoform A n=1 Tax=Clunio marinus TaxID=568069 RepID=A0A1J1IXZ8_9DIPT|nr:CLUMA_CG018616, isoform A [Clunio marinus]